MANGRGNWKFIKSLVPKKGVTLGNIENILEEIVCFFGKLHSKSPRDSLTIEGLDWCPTYGESVARLDHPFFRRGGTLHHFLVKQRKDPRA